MNSNYYRLLFINSLQDFKRNKVRTTLTSLGIMIGVLSVVLLIALGVGLKNYLKQQFEGLGANLIIVLPGQGFGGEAGIGGGFSSLAGAIKFDERDYKSLQRISNADYVVPGYMTTLTASSETADKLATVQGVNEDAFKVLGLELISGDFFNKADVASASKVGVIAEGLAEDLYGDPEDALGKTVKARNLRIKIIGLVENIGDPEQDRTISIPYTATFGTLNPDKNFFAIYIGVESDADVIEVKKEAEEILLRRYEEDEFSVTEQSEILSTVNQIFSIVNGVLLAIGSISLLVGGVGIMNIMYANVTERTKEIGIRRAIGATKKDILLQFLVESVVLSLFGGIIGLVLGALIIAVVQRYFPAAINAVAVTVAFGVSSLIGIVFGVFPARRAANLTPIEAIKYE